LLLFQGGAKKSGDSFYGASLNHGKWTDIGKFKGSILRNLAARVPYFHNGSVATLCDAVNFTTNAFRLVYPNQKPKIWWRSRKPFKV
jgi:cytochrome c peroxidase